jgi:hypothetical protein
MSPRTIMALFASVVVGFGFLLTVSTDASAQRRAGVYRGGGGAVVVRPGYRGRYYRPGVAAGAAALGAAAVVGAAAAGAYYAPGYYGPGYYGPGPGVYVAPQCGYYPYPPCY